MNINGFLFRNNIMLKLELNANTLAECKSLNATFECILKTGEVVYEQNCDVACALLESGIAKEVYALPTCKFILPMGIPIFDAFDVQFNLDPNHLSFEVNCSYINLFKQEDGHIYVNDSLNEYDQLYLKIVANKILYDYECNLRYVERFFKTVDVRPLLKMSNFAVLRIALRKGLIFCIDYALSAEEAERKNFTFRREQNYDGFNSIQNCQPINEYGLY